MATRSQDLSKCLSLIYSPRNTERERHGQVWLEQVTMILLLFCYHCYELRYLATTVHHNTACAFNVSLHFAYLRRGFHLLPYLFLHCELLTLRNCLWQIVLTFTMDKVMKSKKVVLKVPGDSLRKIIEKLPASGNKKRKQTVKVSQQTPSRFYMCL